MRKIELRCSIPPVQSALKFGAKIGRVTFEIPESELPKAVALIALQETPLRITIEVDDGYQSDNQKTAQEGGEKTARARPWLRKSPAEAEADG